MPPLPAINACLNAASALLLAYGFYFIRRAGPGKDPACVARHRACMLGAFACSALFLASYLVHHWRVGSVRFPGTGGARTAYLVLLASHSVLAAAVLPMALRTLQLAAGRDFERHARLARWTLPAWLYVSVTGIAVFAMLYVVRW